MLLGHHGIAMTDQELMSAFQSLGEDCEFSFIQRRFGAEPLEMLRFTATTLDQLIAGFKDNFATIGDPEHTFIKVTAKKELWLRNRRHGFEAHVFKKLEEVDLPVFEAQQCQRLQFLRRNFFEDIEDGTPIFVYKRRTEVDAAQVAQLHELIRAIGPATLLWVVRHDDTHAPGAVEQIGPGFVKGYIDEFTPYGRAAYGSKDIWLQICRNAHGLVSRMKSGSMVPSA
jgi:hypothetical protein